MTPNICYWNLLFLFADNEIGVECKQNVFMNKLTMYEDDLTKKRFIDVTNYAKQGFSNIQCGVECGELKIRG
jgi:hypothetical protein